MDPPVPVKPSNDCSAYRHLTAIFWENWRQSTQLNDFWISDPQNLCELIHVDCVKVLSFKIIFYAAIANWYTFYPKDTHYMTYHYFTSFNPLSLRQAFLETSSASVSGSLPLSSLPISGLCLTLLDYPLTPFFVWFSSTALINTWHVVGIFYFVVFFSLCIIM